MRCKTRFEDSFVAKKKLQIKTKLIINCIIFTKHFLQRNFKCEMTITAYLNERSIPVLTGKQSQTCEGPILENELLNTLKICQITSHSEMMA